MGSDACPRRKNAVQSVSLVDGAALAEADKVAENRVAASAADMNAILAIFTDDVPDAAEGATTACGSTSVRTAIVCILATDTVARTAGDSYAVKSVAKIRRAVGAKTHNIANDFVAIAVNIYAITGVATDHVTGADDVIISGINIDAIKIVARAGRSVSRRADIILCDRIPVSGDLDAVTREIDDHQALDQIIVAAQCETVRIDVGAVDDDAGRPRTRSGRLAV